MIQAVYALAGWISHKKRGSLLKKSLWPFLKVGITFA
jgi:hypothetical protein